MCIRFFGSKQGNFVPLYHTQVMKHSRAIDFETMDQVPYFYIAFDSLEARFQSFKKLN